MQITLNNISITFSIEDNQVSELVSQLMKKEFSSKMSESTNDNPKETNDNPKSELPIIDYKKLEFRAATKDECKWSLRNAKTLKQNLPALRKAREMGYTVNDAGEVVNKNGVVGSGYSNNKPAIFVKVPSPKGEIDIKTGKIKLVQNPIYKEDYKKWFLRFQKYLAEAKLEAISNDNEESDTDTTSTDNDEKEAIENHSEANDNPKYTFELGKTVYDSRGENGRMNVPDQWDDMVSKQQNDYQRTYVFPTPKHTFELGKTILNGRMNVPDQWDNMTVGEKNDYQRELVGKMANNVQQNKSSLAKTSVADAKSNTIEANDDFEIAIIDFAEYELSARKVKTTYGSIQVPTDYFDWDNETRNDFIQWCAKGKVPLFIDKKGIYQVFKEQTNEDAVEVPKTNLELYNEALAIGVMDAFDFIAGLSSEEQKMLKLELNKK